MADEQAGKRMNFQVWWLSSLLTWGWKTQQTQQTQQTWSTTQTGAVQQQKTTPFLPWISDNAELQAKNKVSTNNGFIQWIQSWNIKTNIQLPWITTKPVEENTATLSPTTDKQKRQSYIYASNNNINTKSTAEQIEEERTSTWKVLWQIDNVWKTYVKAPINNYKKRWFRAIWDSWLTQNFIKKTLEKDWINLSDNTMESIDNIWQHIVQAYTDKINEDFRKLEEKNLDPKIKEKYDNSTIADLIWQGDFAGAFYKMNKWTAENWQMIPEIWLMFVSWPAWLAVMGADVYVQENQWTFEDMINNGATYEEARNWAIVVWIVNAGIELLSERLLWWAKWAGATAFRRLFLKEVQHEVVKTATKKWMAEIFSNWIKEIIKWSLVEWFEEVLQQIVWNAMVRTVNPDRELTEWSYEAFEWGFFNLFNPIWWWVNMVNDVKTNKQIQKNADIEALKYVAEWEQRKAQRIQAKERLKARFMQNEMNPTMDNGYTPTQEEAQQRATENEERQQFEQERDEEYKREMQIEEDMINEVLSEWDLNEDLWDPRYQKSDSPQSASESTVSEKSRTWNIKISPENSSEISKNLNEIKKNLDNLKADTFLQQIKKSILWNEKSSNYITNRINNQKYTLRVSDHNTNAGTSIQHPNNNTSIVIKLASKSKFKKSKNVDMLEFVYDPNTMNTEIMQWIIDWIQNWLQTGKYTDTHYSDMKQSTRVKGQQQSGEKHQLKYEDKDYTPWVANKNEKDISWKEWLNLRNKLNKETVKQLAEKYWIKVEVIEWMIEILEKGIKKWYAYGKYVDDLLTLSEQIKESTAPHELLHAIFDMIDPETKTYLISQVMQSEWWTAEQSEEWLADSFSNFFRTGKIEWAPKSTRWKIKMFFKRVRSFVSWMNKWRSELEEIFTDIIDAKGIEDLQSRINQNEKITKAKEKMKKRFMEYEKNAEKVKKKENNWKYQTVYHWWPNEFDRFDHLHMWEWEWHQAHGRWHYVAVDPKTARNYAENFSRYKWGTIHIDSLSTDEDLVAYKVLSNLQMWMSLEDSMEDVKSYYRDEKKFYENAYKEDKIDRFKELAERSGRLIKAVDKLNKSDFNTKRNFYEVEIPDPVKANTPTWSNYLEEKGEFTEKQLNNFKKMLNKYDLPYTNKWLNEWHIKNWEDLYSALSEDFISDAWASKFLEKMWYDGIHYFWGRDWEAYVIFNDNALEITNHEKYQKANEKRYRWQEEMGNEWRWIKHNKTAVTENTEWWVFVTPYKDDAVKYGDYILEFEKLKENTVTSKEADKLQERATKQVENDLKNQIDTDYLIEQMALWRLRWFAEYTKKPFVETGNPIWEKWEAVFFEDIAKKYNVKYQRVYHWSPNAFDKFDSTHMWEWEWNQAHGRWHYVAVDPKTARTYAQEKFYKNEIEVKWRTMSRVDEVRDIPYALRSLYRDLFNTFAMWYYDVEEEAQNVIDRAKKEYEQTVEYYEKQIRENVKPPVEWVDMEALQADRKKYLAEFKEALEFIEELTPEDIQVREINDRRNFYEVEIPDPVKADTPTWSNYLEEQAKIKKSEINKFKKAYKEQKWEDLELFSSYRDWHIDWVDVYRSLDQALKSPKNASKFLQSLGYDGIHYDWQRDGECYVIFNDDDLEIKNHEKYQKAEYEYDENGNPKRLKFEEDNNEFDPSIFDWSREDQIESDKESEKNNAFYNAWIRYNNQNYKDDQLTFDEFIQWISKRAEKEQEIYDEKMKSLADSQNDPKLLELQLKAVKLMEKEQRVGKNPNGKNVSKEVRERQQKEVETERENLAKEIFDYMYPWLKFEDQTYDDQKTARDKEAEREMMGRQEIEEKLKLYKKDKNGNREAKDIKIDNPDIKLDKILSSWKFDEIFEPLDRVIEWKTPQGQKGRIDNQKDPKKYKSVMEKINSWKSKTKVTLKDVTQEARALEKYKAEQEAEKERKKKERQEAFAKKKQEEYKKNIRLKAFQKLVDMQRFEKYTFLTEDEIKKRRWFSDEEWKKITEQQDINFPPKKRWENAIRDFNKAVDSEVKFIIEWLDWQNKMKRKEAEKNLWEIWDIDIDVLLWKDEEKWQKEVEEFEKIAKEENKNKVDKKKKAEELTKKWKEDVNEMFRKAEEKRNERYSNKEEKQINEVESVEEAKNLAKESRRKRTKKFWKDTTIQDLIQPISSRIEKISPRIYLEMMRFEQRIAVKTNTRMKQVEDFVKKMSEIRSSDKKDYLNITLHLLNGNVGTANKMLEKYWTTIPRQVLDEIWADAEDVGYTMNYEWFYYPRKVKDVKDFLDRFYKTENKNVSWEIDKIIRQKEEQAKKRWEEFTPQMKADLINQLLMDGEVEWISLWSWHMKKRKVESITKNMLEFYEDPVDALLQYISWMTEAVEKARLLWQGKRWEIKTLWEFIADEWISGYDADELKKLLLSRFNYAPMWEMMSKMKVSANIIHLWSPSSALSQLADISFSLIENWLVNLIQWLSNKYNLNLEALWITNRWEEMKAQWKNETWWEKVQRFTFKRTWFNMMDQFWKKSFVVSTLNKLIKYAKKNDPQLRKDLERRFDDPKMIDGIIEDLKEWKLSENVNLFLFTKLADVQPLTRMQMTRTYLQSWNWRVLYAFKTFGIKQLDYIIQKSKNELKTNPTPKALWNIATMLWIIMLCWATADELKDFSMWRMYNSWIWRMINWDDWSVSQLSDRFWDNLIKLTWITKYSIYQARTQWIKSAVEDIFFSLPWLDLFTYPMQDMQDALSEDWLDFSQASSWQLIPIVWKYGYWRAWAGQTKQQNKLNKEKKKKKKGSWWWLKGKV